MKAFLSITAAAALLLCGATTGLTQTQPLPSYEAKGFPITPVQVQTIGSADVQERLPDPTLVLGGRQASPHQMAVLTLRIRMIRRLVLAKLTAGGLGG